MNSEVAHLRERVRTLSQSHEDSSTTKLLLEKHKDDAERAKKALAFMEMDKLESDVNLRELQVQLKAAGRSTGHAMLLDRLEVLEGEKKKDQRVILQLREKVGFLRAREETLRGLLKGTQEREIKQLGQVQALVDHVQMSGGTGSGDWKDDLENAIRGTEDSRERMTQLKELEGFNEEFWDLLEIY